MEEQAARFGLTFNYLKATDGQKLNESDHKHIDHARRRRVSKYPLTDNEVGCWISHRRVLQQFLDSGEAMAVILEDDARLLPGFSDVVGYIETAGAAFDFIDLHRLYKRGEKYRPCADLSTRFSVGRVMWHMHATSYIVTREGAKKILAYTEKFAHVYDKELHRYWANGLDIYALNQPVVIADDNGFSYIDETRLQNRNHDRKLLAGANTPRAWVQRKREQLKDSLQKRMTFGAYVVHGRKVWNRAKKGTTALPSR